MPTVQSKLVTGCFIAAHALAIFSAVHSALADPSPSPSITRKELALRASLFAEGNPERYVGLDMLTNEKENASPPQIPPPVRQQEAQQPQSYVSRQPVIRQNVPQFTQPPQQQPPQQDNSAVAVQQDGSVHVNTGNNNIDRRAEQTINRKVQNFIRSIWH